MQWQLVSAFSGLMSTFNKTNALAQAPVQAFGHMCKLALAVRAGCRFWQILNFKSVRGPYAPHLCIRNVFYRGSTELEGKLL
jgi:hypothetical protein